MTEDEKRPIVWVNGTFDVFHYGHLMLLEHAARIGELHVGVDTDDRVKKLKGNSRPIFDLAKRIRVLAALRCVHRVYAFGSDEELAGIMKHLSPDFMVIGSDYEGKFIVGAEHVKKIVYFERLPGISSTEILNKNA